MNETFITTRFYLTCINTENSPYVRKRIVPMSASFSPSPHVIYLANRIHYPLGCVKTSTPEPLINKAISYSKPGAKPIVTRGSYWQERMVRYAVIEVFERRPHTPTNYLPFPSTNRKQPHAIDQSPNAYDSSQLSCGGQTKRGGILTISGRVSVRFRKSCIILWRS